MRDLLLGRSLAWGSYLNSAMNAEEAPHAYAAVQKAIALKDKANARERALIDALAVRYVETFDPEKRIDQDKAYAEAIGKVSARLLSEAAALVRRQIEDGAD